MVVAEGALALDMQIAARARISTPLSAQIAVTVYSYVLTRTRVVCHRVARTIPPSLAVRFFSDA